MRHAAALIPLQHLALVLAEISASVWPRWHKADPDDWQLAWDIAALRAWALGETTLEQLRLAVNPAPEFDDDGELLEPFVDEYGHAWMEYSDSRLGEDAVVAAAVTVLRAVRALDSEQPVEAAVGVVEAAAFSRAASDDETANRVYEAWSDALDAEERDRSARDDRRPDEDLSLEERSAYEEGWELADSAADKVRGAWRKGFIGSLESSAAIIRTAVPWRTTLAADWTVIKDLILSGDAVLRLSGWTIVDAVRREEKLSLEGERAVAFDEAQERAGLILFQSPRG